MAASKKATGDTSLQKVREKYVLFVQVIELNINQLEQLDKQRGEIIARFTSAINKVYEIKEKKIGDETERAVREMCKDLERTARNFLKGLESQEVGMSPDEIKQMSGEWDRCEDKLRRIESRYCATAHYKNRGKGNQEFSLEIWGLQIANNHLRDFARGK